MLKEQQRSIIVKVMAIQGLIRILNHNSQQNIADLQKQIKQQVFNIFGIKSKHYWRSISCFFAPLADIKWKDEDRSQIIKYYQQILQEQIGDHIILNYSKQMYNFGNSLLLQVTNLLKRGHVIFTQSISIMLLLCASDCLEQSFRVYFLAKIFMAYPNEMLQLLNKGQRLFLSRQFDQAEIVVETGISICKRLKSLAYQNFHAQLLYLNDNILKQQAGPKLSTAHFISSAQKDKEKFMSSVTAIDSCLLNKSYKKAHKLIKDYQSLFPGSIDLMAMLVAVLSLENKYVKARELYQKMMKMMGESQAQTKMAHYYLSLGIFHFKMMEYQLSRQNLEKALKQESKNVFALKWMAYCCFRLKKYKISIRYFNQVDKLLVGERQKLANSLQVGIVYSAILLKDYGYFSEIRNIIKKAQAYYEYNDFGPQSLILLQLYSCTRQLEKTSMFLSKHYQISPIFSLQNSRAHIFLCISKSKMDKSKKSRDQLDQYFCQTGENTNCDLYQYFQQTSFLTHSLVFEPQGRKTYQQKVQRIINRVSEFSVIGGKYLKQQLQEMKQEDFQITMNIK